MWLWISNIWTHGKKSSLLIGQDSFVAYLASVYIDGVEYRALTRPSYNRLIPVIETESIKNSDKMTEMQYEIKNYNMHELTWFTWWMNLSIWRNHELAYWYVKSFPMVHMIWFVRVMFAWKREASNLCKPWQIWKLDFFLEKNICLDRLYVECQH